MALDPVSERASCPLCVRGGDGRCIQDNASSMGWPGLATALDATATVLVVEQQPTLDAVVDQPILGADVEQRTFVLFQSR